MDSKSKGGVEVLLLSEREAAASLGLSPRKLWSIRTNGEIAYVRNGRSVRYAVDDLKAWIEGNKVLPTPSLN
jgi:excisionase family DNA binding protein